MTSVPSSLTDRNGSRQNPHYSEPAKNVTASLLINVRCRLCFSVACAAVAPALLLGASISPAKADFRLCNNTGSRVGVAIGYKDNEGWTTEGWWNVSSRSCETLLRGALVARYYYIYAIDYDRGGEWSGKAYMCSREKEFTIRGTDNCLARGYDRTGFFEVDTGEQRSWTVQLTDAAEQPPERPLAPRGPVGVSRPPTTPPLTPPSSPMTPPSATSPTSPGGSRQ
jgi:uncharacterized membrane protein